MARNKGTFNFAANFEVLAKSPLDARQVVENFSDLTTAATWEDAASNIWLFDGLIVAVTSDSSITQNGVYYLKDATNYSTPSSWAKVGSDSDLSVLEASIFYNQQVNLSQDASILNLDTSIVAINQHQAVQDTSILTALSKDTSVQNVGIGEQVYRDTSNGFINLRTIVGSSSIDVSTQGDVLYLSIDASFSGGEINYGENIGDGDVSLYYGKQNEAILIRSLKGSGHLTVSYDDASTIILDVSGLVTDSSILSYGFITEASLGTQFNWQGGLLHVDVSSSATDASLNQLWAIVGGIYDSSIFITTTDSVTENISELDRIVSLLAPVSPGNLSTITLNNPGYYSARVETSGTLVSEITDNTTPLSTAIDFLKEIGVQLVSFIDGTLDGSILVTSSNMAGSFNNGLTITIDEDAYDGEAGKEGFWRQLTATIVTQTIFDVSTSLRTYNLQYPDVTNETGNVSFYVDAPTAPSITAHTVDVYPSISKYVSGVPSYDTTDSITISYNVNSAVGKFYNQSTIGTANLNAGDDISAGLPGAPYTEGTDISVGTQVLTFDSSQYYESGLSVSITPYNSLSTYNPGIQALSVLGRIDTVSDESDRVTSGGLALFPISGYGGVYDSSISLESGPYSAELQKLNNLYQFPTGNYTGWSGGPNYSSLDASTRWVTFETSVTNATSFTLVFSGASGFSANPQQITTDVSILAKVDGALATTGWVNCNLPYPGVGNPTNNDDGAMVVASSNATTKVCTFGTLPKTGILTVRVGISPSGSPQFVTTNIS